MATRADCIRAAVQAGATEEQAADIVNVIKGYSLRRASSLACWGIWSTLLTEVAAFSVSFSLTEVPSGVNLDHSFLRLTENTS